MNKYICIILFLYGFTAFTQQPIFKGDPDKAFETARELAFNKQRKEAQDTLRLILTKYPNYHDIRSFLASTYSWDGDYKSAKKEFVYVLKQNPKRLDTWEAAIKNELYSEAPKSALNMANSALSHFPNNPEILYLKASAEDQLNHKEDALKTIENLLKEHPDHNKAKTYKLGLIESISFNTIGLKSSVDLYSEVFDPMQYYLVNYARQTKYGSIHLKANLSNRFASTGAQFEVDLYPRLAKGLYGYANFGVSNSFLYPEIRYGAELHKSFPKSIEGSLGFRALKYQNTTTIYTGSIGWYTGNDYWSFRAYVTPGNPKASKSGTLSYRKYRNNANNYLNIEVGIGFSPEINRFIFEGNNENTIINLKSQKLNLGYFFSSKNNMHIWGIQTGVSHQEISFDPGNYFLVYSFGLSWDLKFM
ncbi:YaiO family outer membrane beta-barrel protein [Sabulilitoribacter arenilitoris]|uniref:YaiO family outer membrane beta-barrel protein n=1 Tax=Wocania arenilitoris TaxID=2044858 RepID=A0AAE3EM74_9FLAO|nr:YaiO family outer membrane beta-barrel protein [Wocania arenilitoris]MCF7567017.1 YaiO family outer membrane beta-barrel protein [Wocania arenilitoris]